MFEGENPEKHWRIKEIKVKQKLADKTLADSLPVIVFYHQSFLLDYTATDLLTHASDHSSRSNL